MISLWCRVVGGDRPLTKDNFVGGEVLGGAGRTGTLMDRMDVMDQLGTRGNEKKPHGRTRTHTSLGQAVTSGGICHR